MLLSHLLVPLMQLFQLFRVVLDVAPRAARRVPMRLRLLLESLDRRQCEQMVPPCVPTRGSAAAPRVAAARGAAQHAAARDATRRGGGASAHSHTLCSSGALDSGALDSGVRRRA